MFHPKELADRLRRDGLGRRSVLETPVGQAHFSASALLPVAANPCLGHDGRGLLQAERADARFPKFGKVCQTVGKLLVDLAMDFVRRQPAGACLPDAQLRQQSFQGISRLASPLPPRGRVPETQGGLSGVSTVSSATTVEIPARSGRYPPRFPAVNRGCQLHTYRLQLMAYSPGCQRPGRTPRLFHKESGSCPRQCFACV